MLLKIHTVSYKILANGTDILAADLSKRDLRNTFKKLTQEVAKEMKKILMHLLLGLNNGIIKLAEKYSNSIVIF
jgi:hypothetical protein